MRTAQAVLFWLVLCLAAPAHEITFSQLDLKLTAKGTELIVKVPDVALLQEVPSSLPAGTSADELSAASISPGIRSALEHLVLQRIVITAGGDPALFSVSSVAAEPDYVVVTASAKPVSGTLAVEANLFPTDPLHKVFATIYRGPDLAGQYALDTSNPGFVLAAAEQSIFDVVRTFVFEGIHHIFIGPDHIVFVVALLLLGGTLSAQLKIITAFTLAHSVTLTLASLDILQLPSQPVESFIALSIVVVGLHDLWRLQRPNSRPRRDWRVLFAFAFGLIHGFGFASVLTELALPQHALAWSLAAFNIGVEIGQATIVLVAAPVIAGLRRYAPLTVSRLVLTSSACGIIGVGTVWLIERQLGI